MYERYRKIRDEKGLTDYKVSKDTGIGRSIISDWKTGKCTPKIDKIQKIADYLGVNVELITTGKENAQYYLNQETAGIAQEIFENKEMRVLFDAARDAQPEDLKTVYDMLLALKRKEKGD